MKTILALVILAGFGIGMVGCNTTEGVGKDTKAAGQGIENAADNAK